MVNYRTFGPGYLYRGLDAKIMQSFITAGFMFTTYEKMSSFILSLLLSPAPKLTPEVIISKKWSNIYIFCLIMKLNTYFCHIIKMLPNRTYYIYMLSQYWSNTSFIFYLPLIVQPTSVKSMYKPNTKLYYSVQECSLTAYVLAVNPNCLSLIG